MKNLNVLNKSYSSVLTDFINIIGRLLYIQPKIIEHSFFRPLKQMLSSKFSNVLATNKTAEQLVQYFVNNKAEFAYSFIFSWYNAGKVPPHRENIVSLIPDIENDQRPIEPSKFFDNYYATGIGSITMIPAILNTIMSFLIEENLNAGWAGLLSVGINSWFRNLTYDSLNNSRELELISIGQIIEYFSNFIDNYVSSFLDPSFLSSGESLIDDDDWIKDMQDKDLSMSEDEEGAENKPIISDIQFKTDQNAPIDETQGPVLTSDNAAQNYLLENILNLKQEEKKLSAR